MPPSPHLVCCGEYISRLLRLRRKMIIEKNDNTKRMKALLFELVELQNRKIALSINGSKSFPEEIVCAYVVAERGTYMRDYIEDEGVIRQIDFIYVKEE